ncbi:hypothetical protein [Nocardia sp. NPDC057030]|uniref:hypothetical protein n=1 Tax=unclassified Nocardia TaxID=2637762 RepID=UPI003643D6AB
MTGRDRPTGTPDTGRGSSAYRHAAFFVGGVVVLALVAMAIIGAWVGRADCADCAGHPRILVSIVPAGILLVGTLAAFGTTYRVWRRGGSWVTWQGAGWFLMTITLIYVATSAGAVGD